MIICYTPCTLTYSHGENPPLLMVFSQGKMGDFHGLCLLASGEGLAALQESHPQFPAWAKAWRLLSTWKRSNCSLAKSIGIGPKDGFYSKASRIQKHDLILVLVKYNHIIFYIMDVYLIHIYIYNFPLKKCIHTGKRWQVLVFCDLSNLFSKKSPGTPLL